MTTVATCATVRPASRVREFFERRLVRPLVVLLTQGLTVSRLSATLATGTVCSLFPFLGTTSLLNLLAGLALRMNQPLLQVLNQLLGPLQLVLILVHVRLGEWIWQSEAAAFSLPAMVRDFGALPFGEFLARFGQAGLHALTGWAAASPVVYAVVYVAVQPLVRTLARRPAAQPASS
jgi:uncharacterized protein (DUF2062 family)